MNARLKDRVGVVTGAARAASPWLRAQAARGEGLAAYRKAASCG